mmetsp:Transcript_25166/g.52655  ORF Transcript_25166/g.52655 Transcript_25166/m.52655 type:complete len:367 (-) Transcript_25166:91-1191(-)
MVRRSSISASSCSCLISSSISLDWRSTSSISSSLSPSLSALNSSSLLPSSSSEGISFCLDLGLSHFALSSVNALFSTSLSLSFSSSELSSSSSSSSSELSSSLPPFLGDTFAGDLAFFNGVTPISKSLSSLSSSPLPDSSSTSPLAPFLSCLSPSSHSSSSLSDSSLPDTSLSDSSFGGLIGLFSLADFCCPIVLFFELGGVFTISSSSSLASSSSSSSLPSSSSSSLSLSLSSVSSSSSSSLSDSSFFAIRLPPLLGVTVSLAPPFLAGVDFTADLAGVLAFADPFAGVLLAGVFPLLTLPLFLSSFDTGERLAIFRPDRSALAIVIVGLFGRQFEENFLVGLKESSYNDSIKTEISSCLDSVFW